jgi:hypothetical protein
MKKPSIVPPQLSVRLHRPLRAKLEREAEKDQITLNAVVNRRLEYSFQAEAMQSIEDLAGKLATRYRKLVEA